MENQMFIVYPVVNKHITNAWPFMRVWNARHENNLNKEYDYYYDDS